MADIPACYFLFEIVGMGLLAKYINYRHDRLCRTIIASIK